MDQAVAATPSKTLRLLLVEDDPDERLIAQFWLAQADGADYDVTWAATYDEGLERLHDDEFDACLVDHRLGPHDSLEFLRAAHAGGYSVPVIVLTGTDSPQVDEAAMRLGAADFLVKSHVTPSILDRSLRRAVQRQRARTTIGPRGMAAAEGHEGPTVLIVDDREVNRYMLGRALTDGGYGVVEASSGAEALARAREGVDLVVLDVRLPDLDGFEVCRRLKSDPLTSRLPVVMCSAHLTGSADRIAGLEGGADAYLAQPFEPREALATVAALLRARQEAESRLSRVVDQVPCLVWTLDMELRFASVAGGSLVRLGLDPADLLGRRLADVAVSGEGDGPGDRGARAGAGRPGGELPAAGLGPVAGRARATVAGCGRRDGRLYRGGPGRDRPGRGRGGRAALRGGAGDGLSQHRRRGLRAGRRLALRTREP